jgi:riboflavin kinase
LKLPSAKTPSVPVGPPLVHQPDYRFAAWCRRQYGINRGIYNTIDDALYRFGLKDIATRRKTIVSFLDEVYQSGKCREKDRVKFGKGMLMATLHQYLRDSFQFVEMR